MRPPGIYKADRTIPIFIGSSTSDELADELEKNGKESAIPYSRAAFESIIRDMRQFPRMVLSNGYVADLLEAALAVTSRGDE